MIRKNIYIKSRNHIDMSLLIGTPMMERWNMPMYNTDITLWKGVDNTIEFSVRNHDRKAHKLPEGSMLKFVAINNKLQQVIEKPMVELSADLGRYEVTLTKDELNDYDFGVFVGHVSVVDEEGNEDLLYSGVDWFPNFNVEIKPNKLELAIPSFVLESTDFTSEPYQDPQTGKPMEKVTSSMLKSDVTPYHTFLIKLKDFQGIVKIQGSNMETPEHNDSDWFDIDSRDYAIDEEAGEEPFTGSEIFNEELNTLWVRVQYIKGYKKPDTIEEVTYRN